MNNKEFIAELSQRSGYSQEDTQKLMRTVVDAMGHRFEEGAPVFFQGFGTFEVKKRLERTVVSPTTGQRMLVPPKLVLNFRPVAAIKEKLKKGEGTNE
ncbi:MAG: HU family DNA-binding protein [Prevotella sp.]|nr:HU family DNA-binding protein [Prevotella sp.]